MDGKHPGGRVNDPGAWTTCGKQADVSDRTCDSCGATKPITDFPFETCGAGRGVHAGAERRTTCRSCWSRIRRQRYYAANRERIRAGIDGWTRENLQANRAYKARWRMENRDRLLEQGRKWREANKVAASLSQAEWRRKNADRKRANDRAYQEANRDRIREQQRQYYAENSEAIASRVTKWVKANPEKRRKVSNDYRSRKFAAEDNGVAYTAEQLASRIAYYGDRCWVCFGAWTDLDHVKPLKRGGPNMLANLRPICRSCNSTKHAAWPMVDVLVRVEHRIRLRPVSGQAA